MRVLQLSKFYPPFRGGIETVTYDITEVLNKNGIKCDVLCSNTSNTFRVDKFSTYSVYRARRYGKLFSTSIAPGIITILKSIINEYDIIHIHLPDPMTTLALFLIKPSKQKIVVHWHSDIIKQKFLLNFYLPFQNWLLRRADIIICTSPKYIAESLQLKKFKDKCIAIPIGIDPARLKVNTDKVDEIRRKYSDKNIIFSLGRLSYYKGFEYLIKSAKYLNDDYIIIVGGIGELSNTLKSLIRREKLDQKVFLIGNVSEEDLGSYYAACNIFCLPSIQKSEAFGVVLLEAMRFGKPVVATKIIGSGVDWVNQDKFSGINVKPMDEKALASAFHALLNDECIYEHYSLAAKKRFNNEFQRSKMVKSIVSIYTNLLNV